jgi:hypothetical protein
MWKLGDVLQQECFEIIQNIVQDYLFQKKKRVNKKTCKGVK